MCDAPSAIKVNENATVRARTGHFQDYNNCLSVQPKKRIDSLTTTAWQVAIYPLSACFFSLVDLWSRRPYKWSIHRLCLLVQHTCAVRLGIKSGCGRLWSMCRVPVWVWRRCIHARIIWFEKSPFQCYEYFPSKRSYSTRPPFYYLLC